MDLSENTNQKKNKMGKISFFTKSRPYLITFIRILIGWHFLYEGIAKLFNTSWTASPFLLESTWLFSGIFKALASNPSLLSIVNFLNIWGLVLIGTGLFLGLFTRVAAWSGVGLLLLYYLAHPPFIGLMDGSNLEGSYLWVNKNLIEMFFLVFLAILPIHWMYGVDNLIGHWRNRKKEATLKSISLTNIAETDNPVFKKDYELDRRAVLKNLIPLPLMGVFGSAVVKKYLYETTEDIHPLLQKRTDAISSASQIFKTYAGLNELKEKVPMGKIGNLEVGRLISGGNLLSGMAHPRDLKYVNELMRHYFTQERVWETFRLCEACGINSALVRTDTHTVKLINQYWKMGGKIQWLAQTKTEAADKDITINAEIAMDSGASAIYIQGDNADDWVHEGRFDKFDQWFSRFQGKGIPLGVGAHELDVVQAMEARGYPVDFYMKTIHNNNYWSYQPDEPKDRTIKNNHDNYWCRQPEETAKFMETVNKPWIGFKILAAGAIKPEEGFQYAFESGADFVCVGMLDFQVVEDCNILTATLQNLSARRRKFIV
jgi:uncharacterized membrane protein YphA (DoxX/SURF4 family)